ncbi:hypothetical protein J2128_002562 [Methanomicrobium sp. W14]|nr:hypothetical protein [Methanomicrobium sp. W14]MBP2134591.1 hypothetical protein [Methanomicrobium sp. W14]
MTTPGKRKEKQPPKPTWGEGDNSLREQIKSKKKEEKDQNDRR